jgi:hypothetical protein
MIWMISWVVNLRGCVRCFCVPQRSRSRAQTLPLLFLFTDSSATSFIELELQVGVGRDNGISAGEFCPIFYRR